MIHTKKILWLVAAVLMLMAALPSCIEDGFTTSSSDVLAFNKDTVAFDTVITLQGSATKQMVVYNRSPKQINISSIKVAGLTSRGHFHLNVDGVRGDEFQNVEIRGNDSIFIFIEAYLDEMEKDEPTLLEDELVFVTNGMTQRVLLSAWGQDVVRINGDTISSNTRFTANRPYLIYDTLFVDKDATLTLDAGTTLLFHDKAALRCAGKMLANGTAEAPITFRGDRLDRIVGETSFDIMSRQWGGVIFTTPSMGSGLNHVTMTGSTIGMHCRNDYADTTQCALKLVNCVLTNSASTCLAALACKVEAIGTEFSDAALEVTYFEGCNVRASQCTFANNYLFEVPDTFLINVCNAQFTNGDIFKTKAYFDNCILYNALSKKPEINNGDLNGLDVYLRCCLMQSSGSDDNNFINCIWGGDPKFLTVREDHIFDYRLGNESDAIGKGYRAYCPEEARYDRYGNDRFATGAIDLGAYVWIPIDPEDQ